MTESEPKNGRPTIYTDELAEKICALIASGWSVRSICSDDAMPSKATVMLWLIDGNHDKFSDQYAKARHIQAETLADELFDIADDGSNDWMKRHDKDGEESYILNGEHVQRSRLRLDTRKWYLSKVLPKFADKQQVEHSGKINYSNISDEELDRKLNDLIANQTTKD